MTGITWAALRALLAEKYDVFKGRLTRQLGSEELAAESLHEAWLRLNRHDDPAPVRSPAAFLLQVARNIAVDTLRGERQRLSRAQVDALFNLADPAPGPDEIAQGRLQLAALQKALGMLPARTRAILMASRMEGLSHQAIADRLGISRRTVLYELRRAVEHLDACLQEE